MNDVRAVLDELVTDAPVGRANWQEVVARSRRPPAGERGRRRLVIALAAVLVLGLAGVAIAAGFDLLTQQERFHERTPDDPERRGRSVEVASGDGWALIAWNSDDGLCLDFAVADNATFGCDFPVRGAKPAADATGSGPPTHAVAGSLSGGNLVGGDGKATVFGVAAPEVARVTVELADGRRVPAELYDAPPGLNSSVRLFILRLRLGELERGLEGKNPIHAYNAYGSDGRLIERVED